MRGITFEPWYALGSLSPVDQVQELAGNGSGTSTLETTSSMLSTSWMLFTGSIDHLFLADDWMHCLDLRNALHPGLTRVFPQD